MFEEASDKLEREWTQIRVPALLVEQILPAFPQTHIHVHARAVFLQERFRHERGCFLVSIDDVLDDRQDRRNIIVADRAGGRLAKAERNRVTVLDAAFTAPAGGRGPVRAAWDRRIRDKGFLIAVTATEFGVEPRKTDLDLTSSRSRDSASREV